MRMGEDEMVVRLARVKLANGFVFLFGCLTVVFLEIWQKSPSVAILNVWQAPPPSLVAFLIAVLDIVQLGFLLILLALTMICLIGLFSPFPVFSVSHAGIRTYSMFGLFGSELTPWSEVTSMKIELAGGPRSLMIYSHNKPTNSRYALVRWLNRKMPIRQRVYVMRGMTSRPFDELVDYILERYEREIQEHGIQVDVRGDG